jgi:hypothetical protein
MKIRAILAACAAVGALAITAVGCSSEPLTWSAGTVETRNPAAAVAYPAGPYGVGKGSIIADLTFVGYANAVVKNDAMDYISLHDFYNPHGRDASWQPAAGEADDRLFPAGSPYGEGKKKPTVLAVDIASRWCGPCNEEAKCQLPEHHRVYGACGGGLFLQLQDGTTQGVAATPKDLYTWSVKYYKEDFPTAIDPEGRLGVYFAANAFPQNLIIDLTNMQIVEVIAGVPDKKYWATYEKYLADPECPAQQPRCKTDADCPDTKTACSINCPANPALCIPGACQLKNQCTQ